ncbi:MAG: M56 family metallopeptidase, partial [Acidobacteriales bacterium]|nr:M56 family metallopeptidase [Terriglobales bacterium]
VVAMWVWAAVALAGLVRLAIGLWLSRKLVRASAGILPGFRESKDVTVPVTVGVFRPVTLLPTDWREWPSWKLDAVRAHERAHIERHDPLHQATASVFRNLCWFHPLSWWLCALTAELAEAASDDDALRATADCNLYAEAVLDFLGRAPQRVVWEGVPMARCGSATKRIDRILSSSRKLSRPLTRAGVLVLAVFAIPLMYIIAAARPFPATAARSGEALKPPVVASKSMPVARSEPIQAVTPSALPAPGRPAARDPRSILVVSDEVGAFVALPVPQRSGYGVFLTSFRLHNGDRNHHKKLLVEPDTTSGAVDLKLWAYMGEESPAGSDPFEMRDPTRGQTKVPLGSYTVPETGSLVVNAGVSYGLPVFRFRLGISPASCLFNPANFVLPPSLKLEGAPQSQGGCSLEFRNVSPRRLVSLGFEYKSLDGGQAGGPASTTFALARNEYTRALPGTTFEVSAGHRTESDQRGDLRGMSTKVTYCLFEDGTYEGDLELVKRQLADIAGRAAQWKRIEAALKDLLARSEDEPTLLTDIQSEYARLPQTDPALEEDLLTHLKPGNPRELRDTFRDALGDGKYGLLERIQYYRGNNRPNGAHPLSSFWESARSRFADDMDVAVMILSRWLPQDVISRAIRR